MKQDHYVNNEHFLKALVEYRGNIKLAKKQKLDEPRLPDYVGECFLKIAENLARKSNFANYSYKEDMISDAVENCLRAVDNFNPTKSKNPFAYFTQIIYFAFLRRITAEKKQLYAKYKATEQLGLLQEAGQNPEDIGQGEHQFKVYENIEEFIRAFEKSKQQKNKIGNAKRKSKTNASSILRFIGEK